MATAAKQDFDVVATFDAKVEGRAARSRPGKIDADSSVENKDVLSAISAG